MHPVYYKEFRRLQKPNLKFITQMYLGNGKTYQNKTNDNIFDAACVLLIFFDNSKNSPLI